ncbi:hypothetical protein M885DRAFT_560663 [Pelagophyceae sp. CCMP2097]|nr:hypothetical protein M885DRAFT_560663 [Pelagophyceae sp. CCMP2097]
MGDAPAAAARKPCCVCDGPGKHCAKCKSRHYCGKAPGEGRCAAFSSEYQDRLLDALPEKLKIKEEPAIVEGFAPAGGSTALKRLPAVQVAKSETKATALNDDAPDWRGTAQPSKVFLTLNPIYYGKGVAQSYEQAVQWYRLAAAQGDAGALDNLGSCYGKGFGVPQDDHEALRLYKRAAAKGDAGAAAAVEKLSARLAASRSAGPP